MKPPREKNGYKKLSHAGTVGFTSTSYPSMGSGRMSGVQALSLHKGTPLIGFPLLPHGKNNAHPNICQSTHRHAVTLALSTLALIIRLGPGLLLGRKPGKLVQGVAQRFEAGKAHMDGGILATLPGYR